MRAVEIAHPGGAFEIIEREIPQAAARGQRPKRSSSISTVASPRPTRWGCSHRRLRPSARPMMAVVPEAKLRVAFAECWRVAFDAVPDKYGFTEAMQAADWQVFRPTEITEPMYGCGDLAGRICRCSGFWSRWVFGRCG